MHKSLLIILISSIATLHSIANELTAEEMEVILSKVETLEKEVKNSNQGAQRNAISAFRSAMSNDAAAFNLYLACQEKIALEEQKKKGGDVRASLRKIKENSSKEFKRALRHQLFWLVYSIEAARNPDARTNSANKLVECLANIVGDAKLLDRATTLGGKPLKQNPFSSVFAKVYKVDHLKPNNWPSSPLDFNGLFKNLIMNELVKSGNYSQAREQWNTRLNAERSLIEAYANDPDSSEFGDTSVELDRYLDNRVPALRWQGEEMLYLAGGERDAIVEMFKILEKYPEHPDYLSWTTWIKDRLSSDPADITADGDQ